jgi:hypothetical protein
MKAPRQEKQEDDGESHGALNGLAGRGLASRWQDSTFFSIMDRRDFIKAGAATTAVTTGARALLSAPASSRQPDLIATENARPGDDFQLTRVRLDSRSSYRSSVIEGYASRQSVKAGETVDLFVSTQPAAPFTIEIFRMGYYGGAGARLMTVLGPLEGTTQPTPTLGDQRLMECQWEPSASITIPNDWPSGVYLGRLTTVPNPNPESGNPEPYWQSYLILIVRDDRPADILFQCSDNTWQAYNRWPVNESLYTDPRAAHAPGVSVSFDRPYGLYPQTSIVNQPLSVGSGEFLLWEYPLCYWLEKEGYDVTYGSNADTLDPANLARVKAMLSVGHDEYWDLRQFHNVKQAINDGLSVLRITRETCYGEFREEEKEAYAKVLGPFENPGPDEREIIGARTVVPFNGGGDWTCAMPDHWLFERTGMKQGDNIPGLVGWEFHGDPDTERADLDVVAEGHVWAGGTRLGNYAATVFEGPRHNIVFNASTIFWSQGLASPPGHLLPWSHWSRPHGPDKRVQQITTNALKRALAPRA